MARTGTAGSPRAARACPARSPGWPSSPAAGAPMSSSPIPGSSSTATARKPAKANMPPTYGRPTARCSPTNWPRGATHPTPISPAASPARAKSRAGPRFSSVHPPVRAELVEAPAFLADVAKKNDPSTSSGRTEGAYLVARVEVGFLGRDIIVPRLDVVEVEALAPRRALIVDERLARGDADQHEVIVESLMKSDDRRRVDHHRHAHRALDRIFRPPPCHAAIGLVGDQRAERGRRSRVLVDADTDDQPARSVRRDGRHHPREVGAERQREAPGLAHGAPDIDRPGRVADLELRHIGPVLQDAVTDKIPRHPELVVVPDAQAPAAPRRADVVELAPLAVIVMLLAGVQLALHERPADILAPGVDARGRRRLKLFQSMAINAVGDAIILPQQVVKAIRREGDDGA